MPKSLPVIIVNGKNICAQFEAIPTRPDVEAARSMMFTIGDLKELDFYKLALIGSVILLSV